MSKNSTNDSDSIRPVERPSWAELRTAGAIAKLVRELSGSHARYGVDCLRTETELLAIVDPDQRFVTATTLTGSAAETIDAAAVARRASQLRATGVVVGIARLGASVAPRRTDYSLARGLVLACDRFGIVLRDFVIVTREEFYSFRELGVLPELEEQPSPRIRDAAQDVGRDQESLEGGEEAATPPVFSTDRGGQDG